MTIYKKSKVAKILRRVKIWGLPLGIILMFSGSMITDLWGTSSKMTQRYWYTVCTEEINNIGRIGWLLMIIGIISCMAWLFSFIITKVSVPCPQCKEFLIQHFAVCPYCNAKLDWGHDADNLKNKKWNKQNMHYCPSCGSKAAHSSTFCTYCGKKLM